MSAARKKAAPRATVSAERRKMLSKVHIAKKDLALDDATYRSIVARVAGGGESAGDCSDAQLHKLLTEFKRLGFKTARPGGRTQASPLVRKVWAIWNDFKGGLSDSSDAALAAFVKRQTMTPDHPDGVSAPAFLRDVDAQRVIEGLKSWRTRVQKENRDAG